MRMDGKTRKKPLGKQALQPVIGPEDDFIKKAFTSHRILRER